MSPKKYHASRSRKKKDRLVMKRLLIDLLGGACIDCGYKGHLAALDFDHVDPKEKSASVSWYILQGTKAQCLTEALKCVVRCANCHRIKTYPSATD